MRKRHERAAPLVAAKLSKAQSLEWQAIEYIDSVLAYFRRAEQQKHRVPDRVRIDFERAMELMRQAHEIRVQEAEGIPNDNHTHTHPRDGQAQS